MATVRAENRTSTGQAKPPGQRASFLLAQLGAHQHRRFAERLAPWGLHPRHFGMLSHIVVEEGQSQQALSRALMLHRSAVVALVDDLEQRGVVERRRDPADRRAYQLYLTARGHELLEELGHVAMEEEEELMTPLDPSERQRFIELLQRVAASRGLLHGVHPHLDPQSDPDGAARDDGLAGSS
jgi:DNA-binding MarR family transcriptional regulator